MRSFIRESRDLVAGIEAYPILPEGDGDRFAGRGGPCVAVPQGDVQALWAGFSAAARADLDQLGRSGRA